MCTEIFVVFLIQFAFQMKQMSIFHRAKVNIIQTELFMLLHMNLNCMCTPSYANISVCKYAYVYMLVYVFTYMQICMYETINLNEVLPNNF